MPHWSRVASANAPSPRIGASLVSLPASNELVLFGGASHEEGLLNDVYILRLDSLEWHQLELADKTAPAPEPRYEHGACLVQGSQLLVFAGASASGLLNDAWILDLGERRWRQCTTTGSMPSPRTCHNATALVNRTLYVFGGGGLGNAPLDDAHVYALNLDEMTWKCFASEGPAPEPRLGHTITPLPDSNALLIVGGLATDRAFGDAWVFSTEERVWTRLTLGAWPARGGHVAAAIGPDSVLVYGGLSRKPAGAPTVLHDAWIVSVGSSPSCEPARIAAAPATALPGGRLGASMAAVASEPEVLPVEPAPPRALPAPESAASLSRSDSGRSLEKAWTSSPGALLLFGGADLGAVYNDVFSLGLSR